MSNETQVKSLVRTIPDHPKPGILFRDITTLLQDAAGLGAAVDGLVAPFRDAGVEKVAGIEARGFVLGGAVAIALGAGFAMVRKHGKLPWETHGETYELEYGTDRVEMHTDTVAAGERVLLVDDLVATGGTARAALRMIERAGGVIAGCAFVIDLPDLGGRASLEELGHRVVTLCAFEGA